MQHHFTAEDKDTDTVRRAVARLRGHYNISSTIDSVKSLFSLQCLLQQDFRKKILETLRTATFCLPARNTVVFVICFNILKFTFVGKLYMMHKE